MTSWGELIDPVGRTVVASPTWDIHVERFPDDEYYMRYQGTEVLTVTMMDQDGRSWRMRCKSRYDDRKERR